ncbi:MULTISPECIES: nucleotidyltransferase family protein [Gammaproteobacteria]|uniref:nucleotidyltransferase family protein n=1 Tax=Gammaproteobacteria TaxID=1236 RepID=UPI000DD0E769|nr:MULTISPECIES: nucleotidyltransferase family protein [Gammaproteobacteria]RTE86065.1 CBS domain-containing protein [Aliidiomarina sp. B3213]TCZ91419.1 CBS domain-containing protein [Lysobacter sp. N42]
MSYNWKNILVAPEATVREAMDVMDSEALRLVLVTDDNLNLLGVITDGDIRRGILKNLSLEEQVSTVMHRKPLTVAPGTSRRETVKMMQEHSILAIPIVERGRVIGLETWQHRNLQTHYQNPVFLMAGGFGTRLRPLTDNCPKPLLKVGEKPILEIVLESFIKAGFINFYISTHYMPEKIREYFQDGSKWRINITYVHEDEPLGTGGALGLLPDDIVDLPMILMNGDVLTNVDFEKLLEFHNSHNSCATMCVREYEYQVPFGVISGEGNQVTSMIEKPIQRHFVNAGIYVVSPKLRKSVKENQRLDMPTLLEQAIKRNDKVLMFPIHEYWLDIGRVEDYKRAQIDILSLDL